MQFQYWLYSSLRSGSGDSYRYYGGTGKGAENGILIKDGEHLELSHRLQAVILDKTGTITHGKPEVTDIISLSVYSQQEILRMAAVAEKNSEHPWCGCL